MAVNPELEVTLLDVNEMDGKQNQIEVHSRILSGITTSSRLGKSACFSPRVKILGFTLARAIGRSIHEDLSQIAKQAVPEAEHLGGLLHSTTATIVANSDHSSV